MVVYWSRDSKPDSDLFNDIGMNPLGKFQIGQWIGRHNSALFDATFAANGATWADLKA
jgi:hypothetical protein